MTKTVPNVKGVDIELNGTTYVLPPLPIKAYSKFDALKKINAIQEDLMKLNDDGNISAISQQTICDLVSLVGMALRRNYPDLTDEEVEDGLEDIVTLFGLFHHIISQNNAVKKDMEQARKNALKELAQKTMK